MDAAPRDRRRAPELMLRLVGYLPSSGAHMQLTSAVHPTTRAGMGEIREELRDMVRVAIDLYLEDPELVALDADEGEIDRVRLIAAPGRTGYLIHGAEAVSGPVEPWIVQAVVALRAR